jgi:hypothetical protein
MRPAGTMTRAIPMVRARIDRSPKEAGDSVVIRCVSAGGANNFSRTPVVRFPGCFPEAGDKRSRLRNHHRLKSVNPATAPFGRGSEEEWSL